MIVHWKKLTNENKGKPEQKFDADFVTIFSKKQAKTYINFSLELGRLKFKNHLRMYRKYWFNFIGLQKNI